MAINQFIKHLVLQIVQIKLSSAIILSTLLLSILSYYLISAYTDFLLINATTSKETVSLNKDRFQILLRENLKSDFNRFFKSSINPESKLATFRLFINEKDLVKLNSRLPESGKEFISAYIILPDSQAITKMKLRYRGTVLINWLYKQKSLRIKLPQGTLYNMERKFNLINPPHDFFLIDYISYDISKELGILSPDSYPVRVFINNEYMGVYSYLSQVDESFLRKNKRMPGSIYYGERSNPNTEGVSDLWYKSRNWVKKSSQNAEKKSHRKDIDFFIKQVNNANPMQFYQFFNQFTDKQKFYSFLGFDTLIGSYHHDFAHNHKIYFDPYKGKFEPIQWDVRFWTAKYTKDLVLHPLLFNIALNPILEMERDKAAYQLLKQYPPSILEKKLRDYEEQVYTSLSQDSFKDAAKINGLFPEMTAVNFSMEDFYQQNTNIIKKQQLRAQFLYKKYNNAYAAYHIDQIKKNKTIISFKVSGNSPMQIDFTDFFDDTTQIQLYKDINNNSLAEDNEYSEQRCFTLYPGRKIVSGNPLKSTDYILHGNKKLSSYPLYYQFIITHDQNLLVEHSPLLGINSITHNKVKLIQSKTKLNKTHSADSIHPWKIPTPDKIKTIELSGDIEVNSDLEFDQYTPVIIHPGTTFTIAPNISLYFYAKVSANGTKTRPIIFKAKTPSKPWGSLVVQGKAASNSHFSYLQLENGSVTKKNLIDYPGQFNIHDVEHFSLENCSIANNHQGDDSLHIAYSSGSINQCTFYNAASDALDIDISQVEIIDSLFINSSNDLLDLMASTVSVRQSVFLNAGDKCISTGEWSDARFNNNLFFQCNIAIEIKDKSIAKVNNLLILESKKLAINLYNKNLRYNTGGKITGKNIFVSGNKTIKVDQRSKSSVIINHTDTMKHADFLFVQSLLDIDINFATISQQVQSYVQQYQYQQ